MKRSSMIACLLAMVFGASSVAFAQQQQPSAVQQSAVAPADAVTLASRGQVDGEAAAQSTGTGGWMVGGVVTGVLTGLIGTAIIWAVAGSSDVSVPADKKLLIVGQPAEYQTSYQASYGQKLKSRRKGSALGGGLLGTAAFVLLLMSAGSSE